MKVSFLILLLVLLLPSFLEADEKVHSTRQLASLDRSWFTGENVRTFNGEVPEVSCPSGYYRDANSNHGSRIEGCTACPRGTYNPDTGSVSSSSCLYCPKGTYGDREGLTSIEACRLCAPGTYGAKVGLKTAACSGSCPSGTYSYSYGLTASGDCEDCPDGYRGWQCTWGFN